MAALSFFVYVVQWKRPSAPQLASYSQTWVLKIYLECGFLSLSSGHPGVEKVLGLLVVWKEIVTYL